MRVGVVSEQTLCRVTQGSMIDPSVAARWPRMPLLLAVGARGSGRADTVFSSQGQNPNSKN